MMIIRYLKKELELWCFNNLRLSTQDALLKLAKNPSSLSQYEIDWLTDYLNRLKYATNLQQQRTTDPNQPDGLIRIFEANRIHLPKTAFSAIHHKMTYQKDVVEWTRYMTPYSIGMFDFYIPNAHVSRLDLKAMPNGADQLFVYCQKHHFEGLMITSDGPIISDLKKYPPNN